MLLPALTHANRVCDGGYRIDHASGRDPAGARAGCSVILPAFEEAGTIRQAIGGVRDSLARDHEVIVVDDSPDEATAQAVRDGFGGDDDVQLIRREDADGLSSAVLRGFEAADHDLLAVMDADLQHPPQSLPVVLSAIDGGADMAVGSRHVETGQVVEWPLHRRIISRGATWMAWAAVPQARALSDPMSGFFAVRSAFVDAVRDELRPRGYKILLELLARCPVDDIEERGYSFREREEGGSNLGLKEYGRFLRHLARLSIPARRQRVIDAVDVEDPIHD